MRLSSILRDYKSLVVALSGGVDSAFLLTFAKKVSKINLLAVTARSIIHFDRDLQDSICLTKKLGIRHVFFDSIEMSLNNFILNGEKRCYFCKKSMLDSVNFIASKNGFMKIAHGANIDDIRDYSPGIRAANEKGVIAPLIEANFSKKDVRYMARLCGVDVWNKPAMACVATRFPYGNRINIRGVEQVKRAEMILADFGFKACRVRHHGELARVEIDPSCFASFTSLRIRNKIVSAFKEIGFSFVSVDLEGYIRGSMNRSFLIK